MYIFVKKCEIRPGGVGVRPCVAIFLLPHSVALATWGMVLRQSPFGGPLTHLHIREFAEDALHGSDPSDLRRREALQLILDSLPLFEIEPEENEN